MNTNSDVGVFNVDNANPRKAIGDASEMEGSVEVQAVCDGAEGEFKCSMLTMPIQGKLLVMQVKWRALLRFR